MDLEVRERLKTAKTALGEVNKRDVAESMKRIRKYAQPYCEQLYRAELREHLREMLVGLTSDLERKSVEPIAVMHGVDRRIMEHFIGGSKWGWTPLFEQLRQEVRLEIGIEDGTLVIDGSATPKKGVETVGVGRQWCGRLGKTDNCVVGVYAAYVGRDDATALVAADLFLPKDWTEEKQRREKVHVPEDVSYRTQAEIGEQMVEELSREVAFGWVVADSEFGRTQAFREGAKGLGKSYIVEVPKDTRVRRIRRGTQETLERKQWEAQDLRRQIPVKDWSHFHVRDGEKGPIEVRATSLEIATCRDRKDWVREMLVIMETLDGSERWYWLAHAPPGTTLAEYVRHAKLRHLIEQTFEECKAEVGLDHFETRTWQGWFHHMVLCLIAHWFLLREKRRLGKKSARHHAEHDPRSDRTSILSAHARKQRSATELSSGAQ